MITFEVAGVTHYVCSCCGVTSPSMLRCGRCRAAKYCSKECQRKHWKSHKEECVAVDSAPVASGPVSAPSTAEMLKPAAPVAVTERAPRRSLPAGAAFFYSDEALPLSLRCDEDYGAHLTLKVDIGPGELLLAAEAYAAVISADGLEKGCHHCFGVVVGSPAVVCEGCAFARYCDEECLNAAAAVHTHECKALSILAGMSGGVSGAAEAIRLSAEATGDVDGNRDDIIDNESLRLAVRIYAKSRTESVDPTPPPRGVYHQWTLRDVLDMEAHEDDVSARKHPFLFKASDILASALKTSDVALLRGLLLRVKYNSYPISNPGSGSTLATGIFPSASYFNHSCAPCVHYSCSVSSEGEWRIFFRSSRPIAVGEDATIAYVDGYQVKEERTRLLRAGYRFDCKCEMCVPPGCPSPLIAAFKCPVCTGPVVPISTYHPPIAPSGRKCSCRSAVTRSMSASDASSSAPTAKEMTTLNLLICLVCRQRQAEEPFRTAEQWLTSSLQAAQSMAARDPIAGMKAVQETLKRDRISLIHDCHRSLFDLHMTGLSVSQVLGNSRLTAMHSLHVLRCLQLLTPTDMPKIATAAVLYATAMKDIGGISSESVTTVIRRALSALCLAYGEDHPAVRGFKAKHKDILLVT